MSQYLELLKNVKSVFFALFNLLHLSYWSSWNKIVGFHKVSFKTVNLNISHLLGSPCTCECIILKCTLMCNINLHISEIYNFISIRSTELWCTITGLYIISFCIFAYKSPKIVSHSDIPLCYKYFDGGGKQKQ